MSATITYHILFEVNILHHYLLDAGTSSFNNMTVEQQAEVMLKYDIRELFDIIPTEQCQKILNAHHCVMKATSQGIIVGIRAEDEGIAEGVKPFNPFADDTEFTFILRLRDMNLLNYSALPFMGNTGTMYVFHNNSNLSPKSFPHIAANPPAFHGDGRNYYPGDMLTDNPADPTILYMALRKTVNNPASNNDGWMVEPMAGTVPVYANENDRQPLERGVVSYPALHAYLKEEVTLMNEAGNIVTPSVDVPEGDETIIQVDMRPFPDGFYTLHMLSEDEPEHEESYTFYLLKERISPFGMIKLALTAYDDAYNMLNPNGSLRSPVYRLHFRNRHTYWRYLSKDFNAPFVTGEPLPLTRYGIITNLTAKNKNNEDVDLPNPGKAPVKTEALIDPDEDKFYSEIHIN
ncbi:MAG: hypothetical protein EA394_10830 [Bacteroidia bacterium]|nr:MAG: hypothetical protein EA394_10830 [Bacteroidia bacterium]